MKRHVVDFEDDVARQSGGAKPAKKKKKASKPQFHGNGLEKEKVENRSCIGLTMLGLWKWFSQLPLQPFSRENLTLFQSGLENQIHEKSSSQVKN